MNSAELRALQAAWERVGEEGQLTSSCAMTAWSAAVVSCSSVASMRSRLPT